MGSWDDVARPVPVGAAVVLVVNDHWLKGAGVLPGAVTGKLSDVAGLFVAGVLAVCVARAVAARIGGRRLARDGWVGAGALIAVAVGFAALKLWPGFNAALARVWGHNVLDATDLFALPVLLAARAWLADRERRGEGATGRFRTTVALLGVVLACAATPAPPPVPPRPVAGWVLGDAARNLRCGAATAAVVKSGKTGFAISLVVVAGPNGCAIDITAARVRFPNGDVIAGQPIELPSPHGPYIIFELDNEARWNRGERASVVELDLTVDGVAERWVMPATHEYVRFPPGHH